MGEDGTCGRSATMLLVITCELLKSVQSNISTVLFALIQQALQACIGAMFGQAHHACELQEDDPCTWTCISDVLSRKADWWL